jgi:phosphonate transport system ATP-binding protein
LDVEFAAGELTAITGPSGAGKSSLLACLDGTLTMNEGRVELDGLPARSRPAWVHQDLQLVPEATLLANVLMARLGRYPWWQTLWSFPAGERRAAVAALEEFGLGELALRLVRETSGGEQQRTGVARAVFAGASLILADEPVANLNEELAGLVLERLRAEARQHGVAVVCVLHHEDQVTRFADAALRFGPQWPEGAYWEPLA